MTSYTKRSYSLLYLFLYVLGPLSQRLCPPTTFVKGVLPFEMLSLIRPLDLSSVRFILVLVSSVILHTEILLYQP